MAYKTAIVGTKEIGSLFSAIGADSFVANDSIEAFDILLKLKKQKQEGSSELLQYAVVFVVEDLLANILDEDYKKLSEGSLPSIISVPSNKRASGFGNRKIRKIVEKAIGSDIFA